MKNIFKQFLPGILITILVCPELIAQGGGFNYQALARDEQGLPLIEAALDLTIEIYQDAETMVWRETQQATTNKFGLFTLEIGGEGSNRTGGTVDVISDISWGLDDHFLKITINDGSKIHEMGMSKINAVPHALSAGTLNTSKPIVPSLSVQGDNPASEEALFEVKRPDGIPVFSVYNEGVRVYVDEGAKGVKGGFAVGGYNKSKNDLEQHFFSVTKDSTRVYFNEETKGVKGGFAVGGYNSSKSSFNQLMSLEPENYLIGHSAGIELKGAYNQFIGYEAGNSASYANRNVYMGYQAGQYNVSGADNVFIGFRSGQNGADGTRNVFIGKFAGLRSTGSGSVYIGDEAGAFATGGWANVFIGQKSGYNNQAGIGTQGARNVFIGREAGMSNMSGGNNTYLGTFAASGNKTGVENVVVGTTAASHGDKGSRNFYAGYRAGYTNTGDFNTVMGHNAGSTESNYTIESDYYRNVMVGAEAGFATTIGNNNTYIGYRSARNNQTGSGNVMIGYNAGRDESGSNKFYLANTSDNYLMRGDFSQPGGLHIKGNVAINYSNHFEGYGLIVDLPAGQTPAYYALWIRGDALAFGGVWNESDQQLKKNIRLLTDASSAIRQLNGVRFDWDDAKRERSPEDTPAIGVLAQDVERVFPELVREGPEGFKAVNYASLIPVLIEAFKEQDVRYNTLNEQFEAQKEIIKQLEERMNALEQNR